jgi:O-antigen chain-terminating methyltransferase
VRPLHPETLKFAMETVRFKNVELHFSSPLRERRIPPLQLPGDVPNLTEFNQRMAQLNELLYGDQDYAVIGWR